jgi:hypothetical protein
MARRNFLVIPGPWNARRRALVTLLEPDGVPEMGIEILFGVGALILLGVLIYGTMFWSKRDKRMDRVTEKGTALEYADEERDRPDRGIKTSPMN